ncbi:hypothetical protein ACFSHQ_18945 [Gemmobacter lanyuensis]
MIRAALADAGVAPDEVDELILSNALGAGETRRGWPHWLRACRNGWRGSASIGNVRGLDAIVLGAALVQAGLARVVVAGGAESYSRRPLRYATAPGEPPRAYDQPPFTPGPTATPR